MDGGSQSGVVMRRLGQLAAAGQNNADNCAETGPGLDTGHWCLSYEETVFTQSSVQCPVYCPPVSALFSPGGHKMSQLSPAQDTHTYPANCSAVCDLTIVKRFHKIRRGLDR